MLATFDQKHQMRVIRFETAQELETCAKLADKVEEVALERCVPKGVVSTAGLVISLAYDRHITPESGNVPPLCGADADGLIEVLDIGACITDNEAQRMLARSLIRQVQAQGVDVSTLLTAA